MTKNKTAEKSYINEKEVYLSEDEFIDVYLKGNSEEKPLKILFGLYKGQYKRLLLSFVFFVIKNSPVWAIPIITANVIDIVTFHGPDMWTKLLWNFIVAVVLIVLNIPVHMLYIKQSGIAMHAVEAGLRGAMVRKLQALSISFHKEMQTGKIHTKVMNDVEMVNGLTYNIFNVVADVVVSLSISLVVIISKSVSVFLIFLVCVPIAAFVRRMFFDSMRKRSHERRKEIENVAASVYDMEELIPITRAHALENREITKVTKRVIVASNKAFKVEMVQNLFACTQWAIAMFLQIICLFFTGYLAYKGKITVGDMALYQTYFAALTGYVTRLMGLLPSMASGKESIKSIGEILSAYDIEQKTERPKINSLKGKYEFKDVSFDYDENSPVLDGLNLTVEAGETIALVGESGSGKTTIINLVVGFNMAQKGQMLVDGKDISEIDLHSYRKMISIVPQTSILFSGSIRENITYGNDDISDERLWEAIRAARLESVIEKLPFGLDTNVGEHGDKLSGGQRQRISIARAIIRDPSVIIFDEATSALDSVTEREIQMAIDNLTRDRTTFIVAHRLSTIKNADKVAVIRDGKCVEYGTYDELLNKKGEFYNYKQMQS